MTLLVELLLATGAILLVSAIENSDLVCSVEWVWNGAGAWPAGCQHGPKNPSGNINTGSGLKSISGTGPGAGGGPGGGSVIHPYGG